MQVTILRPLHPKRSALPSELIPDKITPVGLGSQPTLRPNLLSRCDCPIQQAITPGFWSKVHPLRKAPLDGLEPPLSTLEASATVLYLTAAWLYPLDSNEESPSSELGGLPVSLGYNKFKGLESNQHWWLQRPLAYL